MVCTIMDCSVPQHQFYLLGIQFSKLNFNFIKDEDFSLFQLKIL